MTRTSATDPSQDNDTSEPLHTADTLPCVLCFNAVDPVGAGGLSGDALVIASVGAHALPVATGVYLRDTRETDGHVPIDDGAVAEQARMVAEDIPLQTIKVGFVGSAEALAAMIWKSSEPKVTKASSDPSTNA